MVLPIIPIVVIGRQQRNARDFRRLQHTQTIGKTSSGWVVIPILDVCAKLGASEDEARELLAEAGGEGLVAGPIILAH